MSMGTVSPDRWEIGFRNIVTIIFSARREFEISGIVERVRKMQEALNDIRNIKNRIPFDAVDAATECIRIAKEALEP